VPSITPSLGVGGILYNYFNVPAYVNIPADNSIPVHINVLVNVDLLFSAAFSIHDQTLYSYMFRVINLELQNQTILLVT